jgi:hypothetical protein
LTNTLPAETPAAAAAVTEDAGEADDIGQRARQIEKRQRLQTHAQSSKES